MLFQLHPKISYISQSLWFMVGIMVYKPTYKCGGINPMKSNHSKPRSARGVTWLWAAYRPSSSLGIAESRSNCLKKRDT